MASLRFTVSSRLAVSCSRQNIRNHLAVINVEPLAAGNFQPPAVESHQVQHRRVHVGNVMAGLDGMKAELIGGSMNVPAFHAGSGKPNRETVRMMIAAVRAAAALFHGRRAAELGTKNDHDIVEHAAAFQILEQAGNRLVNLAALSRMIFLQRAMRIPHAVWTGINLHKTDAAFDQPPRGQQPLTCDLRVRVIQAVKLLRLLCFARQADGVRHRHLHVKRELVRLDPRPNRFIFGILNRGQPIQFTGQFKFVALFVGEQVRAAAAIGQRMVRIEFQRNSGVLRPQIIRNNTNQSNPWYPPASARQGQ